MPETTTHERLTIDRSQAIEAVAALDAAGSLHSALNAGIDGPLTEFFTEKAWTLKEQLFGMGPEDEDEYAQDPTIVDIYVRSAELTAEGLDNVEQAARFREVAHRRREA